MQLQIHIAQPWVGTHIQYPDPLLALSSLYSVYSFPTLPFFPGAERASDSSKSSHFLHPIAINHRKLQSFILCLVWTYTQIQMDWMKPIWGRYWIGKELDRKLHHQKLRCIPDVPSESVFLLETPESGKQFLKQVLDWYQYCIITNTLFWVLTIF